MPNASLIRSRVEAALAERIPSALTPQPRVVHPVETTGIPSVDTLLRGGLPRGAITELVGPECSGRTSFALSFAAALTQATKVCAWIDVSDALNPESAAAAGVDLSRLLWIRCGVRRRMQPPARRAAFSLDEKYRTAPFVKRGLHGGGLGSHPRNEVKGLSRAVDRLLRAEMPIAHCAEQHREARTEREAFSANSSKPASARPVQISSGKPWLRIGQALRVADLILQSGGFSAIVLDMGSILPEYALRVPLATWFRYRAAAETSQTTILLLSQHSCAKSSAELLLRLRQGNALRNESTVLAGMEYCVELARRRFAQPSTEVIPLRNPWQEANIAIWRSRATWAGQG